ncbi:hypothetical protein ACQEVZ_43205 [Dactylosporangium sp. CA-152071]|uniref:hypothetical protein n=1 Tax=Dactylosporangium sp. CA-152071 TaxID=3239933 RepID=UPI003D8FBA1C
MQLRRTILALALSTTVALTAACSSEDPSPAAQGSANAAASAAGTNAAGTSAAAAPSQSVDLKANTEAVCKAVVAAYDKEKEAVVAVLTELLTAAAKDDKAAMATAKSKGKVVFDRLSASVNAELEQAADLQARLALRNFVNAFSKVLESDNLASDAFQTEMDKATAEATKYCPALDA